MQPATTSQISSILVPVDFSAGSHAAIEYALGLARTYRAKVTLFHAQDAPTSMNQIVPGADNHVDSRREEVRIRSSLEAYATRFNADGAVDLHIDVRCGSPIEQIVSASTTHEFDLIVMGTHGRTGVGHLIMGSVAEMVVRKAACPVLTVHLPENLALRSGSIPPWV